MATDSFRTESERCVEVCAFPATIVLPLSNYGRLNYGPHGCLPFFFFFLERACIRQY